MSEHEPIERQLKPPYDEERIAAMWNRLATERARAPQPARWIRGFALAGAGIALVVAISVWPKSAVVQPLESRDPSVSLTPGAVLTTSGRNLVFDDESTVALSTGTRLQVLANEGTRFSTLLESGSARFDVHPGGARRWEIETPLASVEVIGTAFTMTLHDRRLEVEVERGVVIVNGERVPGRVVRLTAGQRIVVGEPTTAMATPPAPPTETPAVRTDAPVASPIRSRPAASRKPVAAVQRTPDPKPQTETLAEILGKADQLSSTGDPAGAANLLERFRANGGDGSSGLVSFTLGRLYLDVLGKPELAAVVFDEVIDRGNPRSLIEDAHARRIEALVRAGLRERAAAALVEYEHAYPHGRRIGALHALLQVP